MNLVDVAFFHGADACAAGKLKSANPHHEETQEHAYWNRGYNDEFSRLPPALQAARLARAVPPPEAVKEAIRRIKQTVTVKPLEQT